MVGRAITPLFCILNSGYSRRNICLRCYQLCSIHGILAYCHRDVGEFARIGFWLGGGIDITGVRCSKKGSLCTGSICTVDQIQTDNQLFSAI